MFALLGGLGCHQKGPAAEPEPLDQELGFEIENQSTSDSAIYLIVGNVSNRLGLIPSNATLALTRTWRRVAAGRRLRLRVEVIGSATRLVREDLQVSPGPVVRWTLTPDLPMSQVAVY